MVYLPSLPTVKTKISSYLSSHQKQPAPVPELVWQNPLYFIAFGFGSGAIPFAPGTFGTLLAIPFYLALRPLPLWAYVSVVALSIIFSSILCDRLSRTLKIHDHPGMNIDEFVGFLVTMINAPLGWQWVFFGVILFRFFDIVKPEPIRFLDKNITGGFGMILDDVVAGIFSFAVIQIIAYLFLQFHRA